MWAMLLGGGRMARSSESASLTGWWRRRSGVDEGHRQLHPCEPNIPAIPGKLLADAEALQWRLPGRKVRTQWLAVCGSRVNAEGAALKVAEDGSELADNVHGPRLTSHMRQPRECEVVRGEESCRAQGAVLGAENQPRVIGLLGVGSGRAEQGGNVELAGKGWLVGFGFAAGDQADTQGGAAHGRVSCANRSSWTGARRRRNSSRTSESRRSVGTTAGAGNDQSAYWQRPKPRWMPVPSPEPGLMDGDWTGRTRSVRLPLDDRCRVQPRDEWVGVAMN
jgi:hypothetical protein